MSVTLKSPADVPAVVASLLGFQPTDSVVLLGIGGGPTARMDFRPDHIAEDLEGMSPAALHWSKGVIVALFSDHPVLDIVVAAVHQILPVRVLLAVRADSENTVYCDGFPPLVATPLSTEAQEAGMLPPASVTRDGIVRHAATITDADEALAMARASYAAGRGAHAWIYLDRFEALRPGATAGSPTALELVHRLTNAVPPSQEG